MLGEQSQIILACILPIVVIGLLIFFRQRRESKSQDVFVKVLKVERLNWRRSIIYVPTFEVVSGPHKGKTYRSDHNYDKEPYQQGELVKASISPETGEIFTKNLKMKSLLITIGIAVAGALFGFMIR
ncbi:MAG: hypothetical protein AAFQ10_12535 [Pseudomonadota bacterium]